MFTSFVGESTWMDRPPGYAKSVNESAIVEIMGYTVDDVIARSTIMSLVAELIMQLLSAETTWTFYFYVIF